MFTRFAAWLVVLVVGVLVSVGCTAKGRIEASGGVCKGYKVDAAPMTGSGVQDAAPRKMTLGEVMARLDERDDWKQHRALDLPRHPAEKYLKGWVIVLDPGHGGKSLEVPGWKTGPTGVREAEMNLRVGLMLRKLLEDAGAIVALTRESEVSEIADDRIGDYDHGAPGSKDAEKKNTLQLRAEFANNFLRPEGARPGGVPVEDADGTFRGRGADLFISIHHNASSSPASNYTTVWFHGPAATATVELDAARHLAREIGRALRTDVGLTSPIMDDRQMYKTGFGVLRNATVPAVLCESSFYTNPQEEQRLDDPGYLVREAYAMYVGLCELAYSGRPTQAPPEVSIRGGMVTVTTALDDGLPDWWGHDLGRTLSGTVSAAFDGEEAGVKLEPAAGEDAAGRLVLTCSAKLAAPKPRDAGGGEAGGGGGADGEGAEDSPASAREQTVVFTLQHANFLKAHNWPQRYAIDVRWAPGASSPEVAAVRPLGAARTTLKSP